MAAKVWEDVTLGVISFSQLKDWMESAGDYDDFAAPYLDVRREQFVSFITQYLRTSAARFLNVNTTSSRTVIGTVQVPGDIIPGNAIPDPKLRNNPNNHGDHGKKKAHTAHQKSAKGRHDANRDHTMQVDMRQRRGKSHRQKNLSESVTQPTASNLDNGASYLNSNGNQSEFNRKDKNSSQENTRNVPRNHLQTADSVGFKGRQSTGGSASLGDFLQIEQKGKGTRSKNNSSPRRINPTRLTPSKVTSTSATNVAPGMGEGCSFATAGDAANESPFTAAFGTDSAPVASADTGPVNDFAAERGLLRVERLKAQHSAARASPISGFLVADTEMTNASLEKVEHRDLLDKLITVYSYLLGANLALSLSTEIMFLTNLLVVNDVPNAETVPTGLLDSVHNCVYFACSVLNQQRHLLTIYDRNSLKLLMENKRIADFKPELDTQLVQLFERVRMIQEHPNRDGTSANVNFHCETDNRSNFPTEFLFHSFKKQRDLFYEALQTWEKSHISPNWSFSVSLGAKIKLIVSGGNEEPANLVHFCRLFCFQLLGNCSGTLDSGEDDLDNDTRCFLKALKSQDPNKYARLKERLVRPRLANTAQRSDFPGHQEFYRDFILTANNAKLNAHMIDTFSSEIAALCPSSLANLRIENTDGSEMWIVNDVTSQAYAASVASLRVLAKFLGFLTFLPYRSDVSLTNDIAKQHTAARIYTNPPVDVCRSLDEAVVNHHLLLTIPWIAKYLSMADPITMTLPYYVALTNMLFHLYVTVGQDEGETCPSTVLLVRLSLGWLFETANFPGGQFLAWYFSGDRPAVSVGPLPESESAVQRGGLDRVPLADLPNVLHAACPCLRRLAVVLATRGGSASRHVTPAAVARRNNPQEATQLKLEESFFQGQVASLRRTVTFVAERVANFCVVHISGTLLPQLKAATLEEHENELLNLSKERQQEIAKSFAAKSAVLCWKEVSPICYSRTSTAIEALLPHEMLPGVRQISAKIAARMAHDKACIWMEDNMIARSFEKDIASDLERLHRKAVKKMGANPHPVPTSLVGPKTSHTVKPGGRNVEHNDDACSPTKAMTELRDMVISLRRDETVAVQSIMKTLGNVKEVCLHREDLTPSGEGILCSLTLDLLFYVSLKKPCALPEVLPIAQSMWTLAELCPTAHDAVDLVSPLKLRELAKNTIMQAEGQGFLLLLRVIMSLDCNAHKSMQSQLLSLKENPALYMNLGPTIDDILNRMGECAQK